MPHRLPDHLGVSEIDGRVLMLDLRRDRYLELDRATAAAMTRWLAKQLDEPTDPQLLELGILIPAEAGETCASAAIEAPPQSFVERAPSSIFSRPLLVPEIAATLWRTRRRLRHAGIEAAVNDVRRRKPAMSEGDPLPHVALFKTARRLVPLDPHCLTDSLALSAFLSRRGIRSQLIFGVKLDPFAAHCWLRSGDSVLNDAADSVAVFTPIMVI